MAELISKDRINDLLPASEVKATANEAVAILEKQSVARLINLAANTGEHCAIWEHPLSSELENILKGQGYKITRMSPEFLYKIEGF